MMPKITNSNSLLSTLERLFVQPLPTDNLQQALSLIALLNSMDFEAIEINAETMRGYGLILSLIDNLLRELQRQNQPETVSLSTVAGKT